MSRYYNGNFLVWPIKDTRFSRDLACVASVSVRFRSKERGTRVKDRAKNGASKIAGRGYFSRGQNLGVSLLRNQTETLATQVSRDPKVATSGRSDGIRPLNPKVISLELYGITLSLQKERVNRFISWLRRHNSDWTIK